MNISGAPKTVAEALGQITWLFSQSALHRQLPISSLEWAVMPAILCEQFRVFSFGPLEGLEAISTADFPPGLDKAGLEQMPLGVALWGNLSEAAEEKVERGAHLEAADWNSGDRLWLLELITPFATPENRLGEVMFADLLGGPFAGKQFSMHRTDPITGLKEKITVGGENVSG